MKNNFLFQNKPKKYTRSGIFFTSLQISLMSSLREDSYILISASAYKLLQYVADKNS